jgi:hypothetical protein
LFVLDSFVGPDQEYDAEIFDNDDDQDECDEAPPAPLHRPNLLDHRQQATAASSSVTAAATIAPSPASTVASGVSGGASANGVPATTAGENNVHPFYNVGSWTVDLFSDPYLMGPLQFPNPFQTFPTSSLR